jgi:hypothetical protein
MSPPFLFSLATAVVAVSAIQHGVRLPQITQAPSTLNTLPHPGPTYANLARPASLLVALQDHELKARSPSEIAANVLHKRTCKSITDVGKQPASQVQLAWPAKGQHLT